MLEQDEADPEQDRQHQQGQVPPIVEAPVVARHDPHDVEDDEEDDDEDWEDLNDEDLEADEEDE